MRRLHLSFLLSLFTIHCSLYTATAQTRQQWRDSLEVLNGQISRDPTNLHLHLLKAEANINLEQWDYALAEYGKILHADEKNLAALYFRAYVHMQQNHYDLAKVDYETFLMTEPRHFEARLGLAHVMQKMGRRTEALDQFNTLVEQFPDSATAYAARAAYEEELKQYEVALFDWDEAIRRRPDRLGFVVSKVDALIRQGKRQEARDVLDAQVKKGTPKGMLREWYNQCK